MPVFVFNISSYFCNLQLANIYGHTTMEMSNDEDVEIANCLLIKIVNMFIKWRQKFCTKANEKIFVLSY